ncbi:MAG: PQQ-binding-like beta-propeller repeat protein [Gemmataceae bacterium]
MHGLRSLVFVLLLLPVLGADWPQFRGPNGLGVSPEANLPSKWSKTEGLRWKADLPARGVSSPVIAGNIVYITCSSGSRDDRLHTLAFNATTGQQLWHRQISATGGTACHPMTCMAAPTPVADATGVFALFATGDLVAFDADGTLRWYRSLVGDYPTITNQVGMAASPILVKDKLILPMDNAGESFLAAIDTRNGKNLWKADRKRDINWVTPVLRETGGTAEILFPKDNELVAYNLDTGEKLWSHAINNGGIPSPSVANGVIYFPGGGVSALEPNSGKAKQLWKSAKLQTGMSSPLVYDGMVYGAGSGGLVAAANAKTGEIVFNERLYQGKSSASPVAGDGKVYITNETGATTVLKAGTTDVIQTNTLEEETLGTPAISNGTIFIRTKTMLYAIGAK